MDYIDVKWRHELSLEPVRLVSELDSSRMEIRKLEFFRDGSVGRAWSEGSILGTALSTEPLPSIDQINVDTQFHAKAIDSTEFEKLWSSSVVKTLAMGSVLGLRDAVGSEGQSRGREGQDARYALPHGSGFFRTVGDS